ncbi:MAG: DUF5658 family protein [Bryobacteraceae bacterium]
MSLLIQFSYLQLLDVLTTLVFLSGGLKEANPVVRLALAVSPSPLIGLLSIKLFAVAMAVYCWRTARTRLLHFANLFFAALVAWNLVALLARA